MQGHKKWVLCVAWSPDGEMVATGGMEGALWLWDPKSGNPIGCCKGGPSLLASGTGLGTQQTKKIVWR